MYGVLLVRDSTGRHGVLRAFSGRVEGSFDHPGWVPPMLDMVPTPLELSTKRRLQELKEELAVLSCDPAFRELELAEDRWKREQDSLLASLKQRKSERRIARRGVHDPKALVEASQRDSGRRRDFNRAMREALAPHRDATALLREQIRVLKAERRVLSRRLQGEMHRDFGLALWSEKPWSLASLFPSGPPTGTGECCAPKLLHYANQQGLEPLALAEIWHGAPKASRQPGMFYTACAERCQPLMGALLSNATFSLDPVFEDEWLIAIEKPSGLLTVPGRDLWNQDSLQKRLSNLAGPVYPIHRLDLETSGLVLFAKNPSAQAAFQELFRTRAIKKLYRADLVRCPKERAGTIDLPLDRDPDRPGRYRVHGQGKSARTDYRVLSEESARVEFQPHTGRSHQLRIHAATGLKSPILGDRLYGEEASSQRLRLHAWHLSFEHPFSRREVSLHSPTPF